MDRVYIAIMAIIFFSSPLTVRATVLHVPADYSTFQTAISSASDGDTILVADGTYFQDSYIDPLGKAIRIRSENGPERCIIDGAGFELDSGEGFDTIIEGFTIRHARIGVSIYNASPIVRNCNIVDNFNEYGTAGIGCRSSSAWIIDCNISDNCASDDSNSEGIYGGALAVCESSDNPVRFTNCIVANNRITVPSSYLPMSFYGIAMHACAPAILENCLIYGNYYDGATGPGTHYYGPAVDGMVHRIVLNNCTIADNISRGECGGVYFAQLLNCIVYSNSGLQVDHSFATYSDIAGGLTGEGNFDSDPNFEFGPLGDYYLAQIAAGQPINSPCVDRGSDLAENLIVDLPTGPIHYNELTTRTDHGNDQSVVDLGYHYPSSSAPTPYPTLTPTPIPSETPIPQADFKLFLNQDVFTAGDRFALRALCRGSTEYTLADLYVALDVYGHYWFWPDWSSTPQSEPIELPPDRYNVAFILDFIWPEGSGCAAGILFWGTITVPGSFTVIENVDMVEFSYH